MKYKANAVFLIAMLMALSTCTNSINYLGGSNGFPYETILYSPSDTQIEETDEMDIHFVLESFLIRYPSIFSLGRRYNGEFINWNWGERVERLGVEPLVYVEDTLFYDANNNYYNGQAYYKNGELVEEDAAFIRFKLIAQSFELYDFENDGIPEIVINFVADTWGFSMIYRFIDSEYREMEKCLYYPHFYSDKHGNIIAKESDHGDIDFYAMMFGENDIYYEFLIGRSPDSDFLEYNKLNETLTRIEPLEGLRDELYESLLCRLGIK